MDAAYPLYMNTGQEGHLAASDAAFVDVIHTDGGILGFPSPIGHADFYPNGGRPLQPGCNAANLISQGMFRLFRHYSQYNQFIGNPCEFGGFLFIYIASIYFNEITYY